MSVEADQIRDRRRTFAAPGGQHDRLIFWLRKILPALIGAFAAVMIVYPLFPKGEVSFLLDRQKVAIAEDRLRVNDAMYRGEDVNGRPFSLTAGEAVQYSASEPLVRMRDMVARILLNDGPAVLSAEAGVYDFDAERVDIEGPLRFQAADGYRMMARQVSIDLRERSLAGQGRVEGTIPAGTFSADSIRADLGQRTITLEGNARLRMVPGELRMP